MIDNVILLITGTLHERDTHELLERCHPLGVFDTMPALCVATNVDELYQSVLVETPLGTCSPVLLRGRMVPPEQRRRDFRIIRTLCVAYPPNVEEWTAKFCFIPRLAAELVTRGQTSQGGLEPQSGMRANGGLTF